VRRNRALIAWPNPVSWTGNFLQKRALESNLDEVKRGQVGQNEDYTKTSCETKEAPSLSLCLIVRNEEACLARCLRSVEGLYTEAIVVDTGSTDRTVEIAKEFGAQVVLFPWTGDFSEARNVSLSHATCEWVFCVDADNEIPFESRDVLKNLLATTDVEGFQVTIRDLNPPSEMTLYEESVATRLFRNDAAYRFEGSIHEQIAPNIVRNGGRLKAAPALIVLHHGYVTTLAQGQSRAQRNLSALEAALTKTPDDVYLIYQKGITCFAAGDPVGAEQELSRVVGLSCGKLPPMLLSTAFCRLAQIALSRRDERNAVERARNALDCDPRNVIALQVLGVSLAGLGDTLGAKLAFEALAREPRVTAEVRANAVYLVRALESTQVRAT
jgi:glycosyltransferase involved in cell wall biosynthesis